MGKQFLAGGTLGELWGNFIPGGTLGELLGNPRAVQERLENLGGTNFNMISSWGNLGETFGDPQDWSQDAKGPAQARNHQQLASGNQEPLVNLRTLLVAEFTSECIRQTKKLRSSNS